MALTNVCPCIDDKIEQIKRPERFFNSQIVYYMYMSVSQLIERIAVKTVLHAMKTTTANRLRYIWNTSQRIVRALCSHSH